MLRPKRLPRRLRGIVTDEKGDGVCLERGSHWVVDGREFPWAPGARVVHGRVLVLGGRLRVDGELRAVAIGQPRIEARAAEVRTMGQPFVRLLLGARGELHQLTTFEVRDNAHAHLHGSAIGAAYDEAVVFPEDDWTGALLVLGHRVRIVPPNGRNYLERETTRGYLVRLAP